jgi:hypothetical protein
MSIDPHSVKADDSILKLNPYADGSIARSKEESRSIVGVQTRRGLVEVVDAILDAKLVASRERKV